MATPPSKSKPSRWQTIANTLHSTRGFGFIFAVVTVTGAILAWMPQGQDLIRSVTDGGPAYLPVVALCASVLLLGFQAWFWSRVIVENQIGPRAKWKDNLYLLLMPRLLGIVPFGLLFYALLRTRSPSTWPAWILLILGLAFLTFVWKREAATDALSAGARKLQESGRNRTAAAISISLSALRPIVLRGGLVLAVVAMVVLIWDPVTLPVRLGPAAVVLLAVALIIPVMTATVLWAATYHIRAAEALVVIAALFSLWVDNHAVRMAPSEKSDQAKSIANRPTLQEAFERWHEQVSKENREVPIIFIASEGGASRAGYWTATVMSKLEEATGGEFSRHVFAISSISGGSLGVGAFLASLDDRKPAHDGTFAREVSDFVGRDYLSPALAGALFPDLLQRFLPWPVFPDRASALELGWEDGWRDHCRQGVCRDDDIMTKDYLSLWGPKTPQPWIPIWMIGGALEEDGRPILTSSLNFENNIDAWDFHSVASGDVRLSTAILNGARFPFVSPGGTLRNVQAPEDVSEVHIVDGGYFDAAGVEVLRELAKSLFSSPKIIGTARLKPIFLLITSDGANPPPVADEHDQTRASLPVACRGGSPAHGCPGAPLLARVAADMIGPVVGLYQSRSAHGERLKAHLFRDRPGLPPPGGWTEIVTLDLCALEVPMNWALSGNAKQGVDRLLVDRMPAVDTKCRGQNFEDFDKVVDWLKPSETVTKVGLPQASDSSRPPERNK
ncbi:hypothetical protein HFO26_36740 [Rhizobium leguminosarum]|uniref:hypothetical protein n=1 Tax=Rhizobium leguminosarum TaxID=384 RepID=UPI001C98BE92|nr:hypothetical protein [Rhizobium leguminosarum]MBY5735674.1 hypothetical protein [Rhizobium leguminosarum]